MTIKIFIDIETIPDQRDGAFDRYVSEVEPPGNYKKQETIDKWMAENAEAVAMENFLKTGLTGLHGEICSIAFAVDDRNPISCVRKRDVATEQGLLTYFWNNVTAEIYADAEDDVALQARRNFARPQWIGHNVLDFDLRFLKQRSIICGVQPAYTIPADARHGFDDAFDTMKEWAGWRGYVKLDELVDALGIEAPGWAQEVAEVDGSQVWEMYRQGEYDNIAAYNLLDVWKVREIYRCMKYEHCTEGGGS